MGQRNALLRAPRLRAARSKAAKRLPALRRVRRAAECQRATGRGTAPSRDHAFRSRGHDPPPPERGTRHRGTRTDTAPPFCQAHPHRDEASHALRAVSKPFPRNRTTRRPPRPPNQPLPRPPRCRGHPQKAARAPQGLLSPWAASGPQPRRVRGPRPSGARLQGRTAGPGPPSLPARPSLTRWAAGGPGQVLRGPRGPRRPGAASGRATRRERSARRTKPLHHRRAPPRDLSPLTSPRRADALPRRRSRGRQSPVAPPRFTLAPPSSLTERRAAMTQLERGRGRREGGGGGGEVRMRTRRPGRGFAGVRPPVGPRCGHELAVSSR